MAKIWFQLLNRTSMAGNTTPAHPDSRWGRRGRHLSCIRGAQLKAQNTKEISIETP